MTTIILLLIILFVFVIAAEWLVIKLAYRFELFDGLNARKIHSANIPRLGGIVIFPFVVMSMVVLMTVDKCDYNALFSGQEAALMGLMVAVAVMFAFGLIDDLYGIRYRSKFFAQILSGLTLCASGITVNDLVGFVGLGQLPLPVAWLITVLVVIYVANAFNFIDGIDGLAACLSVMALLYDATLFLLMGQYGYAMICLLIIMALLALLVFNIYGKPERATKVFMGDAGSLSLGVALCALAIILLQHLDESAVQGLNRLGLAIIPLMLPCFDVVRVVFYRMVHKKNIFEADKSHIHHKLLAIGFSQHKTLLLVLFANILLIVSAIALLSIVDVTLMVFIEVMLFTIIIYVINKKIIKL